MTHNEHEFFTTIDLFDQLRENVELIDDGDQINIGCIITKGETELCAQDLSGKQFTTANYFLAIDFLIRSYHASPVRRSQPVNRQQFTMQF